MKDQYRSIADYCRRQMKGRPEDAQWEDFAAHWDELAARYQGQPQQMQQHQGKPAKEK